MPKVETKQTWAHYNEVQLSTLAQGYHVTMPTVTQGVGADQRIGNIINLGGMHLRGVYNNNSTSESMLRFIVIGYDAAVGDPTLALFRNTASGITAGISTVNGLDAMYFPLNRVDLHVYNDSIVRLAGSATGNAGANVKLFNKFVKFNGRKIEYKGTSSGYGLQNWMYSLIWIAADSNDDTSTGTAIELSCFHRMFYKDA